MLVQVKDFDGYIGVIVEFDPSKGRMQWNAEKYLVAASFYTVPIRKDHGRNVPRWERKTRVPNFPRCGYFVPIEYWGTTESTEMFIREQCENILQEIEDHFCKIGECKINPKHCPEKKSA